MRCISIDKVIKFCEEEIERVDYDDMPTCTLERVISFVKENADDLYAAQMETVEGDKDTKKLDSILIMRQMAQQAMKEKGNNCKRTSSSSWYKEI